MELNFWKRKAYLTESKILWVAVSIKSRDTFRARAKTAAEELGQEYINKLVEYLHNPPEKPKEAAGEFNKLGEWLSVCQHSIFEILYNFREAALPLLHRIAFGPYDWTQANAIEILCRLASEGVETEGIAEEICREMPEWRYEAIMYSLPHLAMLAAKSPLLMNSLRCLISEFESDPIDAFEVIINIASFAPDAAREYETFLRGLMCGEGLENRPAFLDSKLMETENEGRKTLAAMSGHSYPDIPDFHSIRAAFLLQKLFPDDEEVRAVLQQWSETHPDAKAQDEIKGYLEGKIIFMEEK
jgi:hypothetical protein